MTTPPRPPGRRWRPPPALLLALLALLILLLILLLALLAAGAVAPRFADAPDWGPDDLAAGAGLLAAAGFVYVLAARTASRAVQHALAGVLLVLAVVLVMARLASGVFD